MITDTDRTFLALRDVATSLTNDAIGISLFIYKYSDLFSLPQIFLYPSERQLRKIGI